MANDKQSLIFKHGFNIDGVPLSDNDLGTVFFERKADDSEEGYLYFYLKDKDGNNKLYSTTSLFKDDAVMQGNVTVNKSLTVEESTILKKNVEIGTLYESDESNGILNIYNNTTIGTTSKSKSLTVYGNTTIGRSGKTQTFTLYGTSTLNGNSFLNGKVAINCPSDTIDSNYPQLKVGGKTIITGATSLNSTL